MKNGWYKITDGNNIFARDFVDGYTSRGTHFSEFEQRGCVLEPIVIEHVLTADVMGVVPGQGDMWCNRVKYLVENGTLAEAGHELAKLTDYALKTQHSDQFNREVRACLHMFWNRCEREQKDQSARVVERIVGNLEHFEQDAKDLDKVL